MIDPKELRIGNIILKDGSVFNYVGVDSSEFYNGYIGASKNGGVVDFDRPEYFYPVPLTKEILTDWCGFNNSESKLFYRNIESEAIYLRPYKDGGFIWGFFYRGHESELGSPKIISYLHELQNLFHSTIGAELEIKIPEKV